MTPTRLPLIALELVPACATLAAVVLVVPGESSKAYALILIAVGVLPGLLLTGDVKLLVAGVQQLPRRLRLKVVCAALLGLLSAAAAVAWLRPPLSPAVQATLATVAALGAAAQAFSPVWFYAQGDKALLLKGKVLSALTRVGLVAAAIVLSELAWALIGTAVAALIEFGMHWRSLSWRAPQAADTALRLVSPLGVAYGVSRVVAASIRIGLSQLIGPLIASLLLIEQLVGGANSLFEKYFARSTRWRTALRLAKSGYLLLMIVLVPMLAATPLQPGSPLALLALAVLACAGLLPLADMYAALERCGQGRVAAGSLAASAVCAALLAAAWAVGRLPAASLAAYVLLPGCTFIFYWLASLHARHDTER